MYFKYFFVFPGYQHLFWYCCTDSNMDGTVKLSNSLPNDTSHLVMLLDKHCKAAEQLALEIVAGMDMPFLNPVRELTKGDCWQILVSLIMYVISDEIGLCMAVLCSSKKMLR
jgi:hypothetical protein